MDDIGQRVKRWLTRTDERFYHVFLLSLIILFGIASFFNILAVGALMSSAMFLLFYETIMKKKR